MPPGDEHRIKPGDVDGVICQLHEGQPVHARRVLALRVPRVEMSIFFPRVRLPRIMPDFVLAGRQVAEHFLANGFRQILFLGHAAEVAGENTFYRGLAEALTRQGPGTSVEIVCWGGGRAPQAMLPDHRIAYDETSAQSRDRLLGILGRLPRPLAAFVADVGHAVDLHDACRDLGLAIPEEVAIVTWTHHPAESELTDVRLSSVVMDYERQAYEAAAVLDRLMRGEAVEPGIRRIACSNLVVRESSNTHAVEHLDVARSLSYIARHLTDPELCVKRIVTEIGMSRTNLYARFRQHMGMSIATYLKRARLAYAKELLAATSRPIGSIARECGYGSSQILTRTLTREEGTTARHYRKAHRPPVTGAP